MEPNVHFPCVKRQKEINIQAESIRNKRMVKGYSTPKLSKVYPYKSKKRAELGIFFLNQKETSWKDGEIYQCPS